MMWEIELVCEAAGLFLNAPVCRVVESVLGADVTALADGCVLRVRFAAGSREWLDRVRAAQRDLACLGLEVRAYLVNAAPTGTGRRQYASA